jgi:hypothetical protein
MRVEISGPHFRSGLAACQQGSPGWILANVLWCAMIYILTGQEFSGAFRSLAEQSMRDESCILI